METCRYVPCQYPRLHYVNIMVAFASIAVIAIICITSYNIGVMKHKSH